MRACVLTIGNEILKGKTVNTNASEIGRMLYFSGYDVYRGLIVPDARQDIGEAFRSLIGLCDVIVSSGGLGPTFDDMTASSFAEEFGIRLVPDEGTYRKIKESTERRGAAMTKEREKMALVPEGCTIIKNEVGAAPGIECRVGSTRIFLLPGVPAEMRSMLKTIENEIKLEDSFYYEDSIKVNGIYEATLAPHVTALMNRHNGEVYIKSHPLFVKGEESSLEVEVSAKSKRLEDTKSLVEGVLREIQELERKIKSS